MKTTSKHARLAVTGIFLGVLAAETSAADLNVEIKGSGDKGTVMVALYKKETKWLGKANASAMFAAKNEGVTVTFKDLAAGEYGLSLFVDENNNGKMDSNIIGMPIEPYAFSNDATGIFGPASFEQAKFIVAKENKTIVVTFK